MLRDMKKMRQNGTPPKDIWKFIEANPGVEEECHVCTTYAEYLEMKADVLRDVKKRHDKQSLPWLERAAKIRLEKGLGGSLRTVTVLQKLQHCYLGLGNYDAAMESLETHQALIQRHCKDCHFEHLRLLARVNSAKGNYKKSFEIASEALEVVTAKSAAANTIPTTTTTTVTKNPQVERIFSLLAESSRSLHDYTTSVHYSQQQLQLAEELYGPEAEQVAEALVSMVHAQSALDNYETVLEMGLRALKIRENVNGKDNVTLAHVLDPLAIEYRRLGDFKRSLAMSQRSVSLTEAHYGADHINMCYSLSPHASTLVQMGKFSEAIQLNKRSVRIAEQHYGSSHDMTSTFIYNLAWAYAKNKEFDKAIPHALQALEIREKSLGPNHPHLGRPLTILADCYEQKGDLTTASKYDVRYQTLTSRNI